MGRCWPDCSDRSPASDTPLLSSSAVDRQFCSNPAAKNQKESESNKLFKCAYAIQIIELRPVRVNQSFNIFSDFVFPFS